jgi:hypothetical protein
MKLECDFSYTCFEAMIFLDPYNFKWGKPLIVCDPINRVSCNIVSRKSFRNFIGILWKLSNEFEMEGRHMEYVTVSSMFDGRCWLMRRQADDSESVCKYHMRRLVRFMVCYNQVCLLDGQPSGAVGLSVWFRRFRKRIILN